MAHITLSIPDQLYGEMKKHHHIKWSEAARRGIIQELLELREETSGLEWLQTLPKSVTTAMQQTKKFSRSDWQRWQATMRKKEWKRTKSWTPA